MLSVGHALEEAVGGTQNRNCDFRAIDQRRQPFAMALAGFAEEHRFDGAAGAQRFFDQAHAFDADETGLRRQSAFQREAKFLEPAIVAASDRGRRDGSSRGASGFARCSHHKGSVTNLAALRLISAIRSGVAASLRDSFVLFFCYPALDSAKTAESCWAKFFATLRVSTAAASLAARDLLRGVAGVW